ncbi:hypothetical protein B14911_22212 [Bacillus sp. NRRL B-14911]|uniref:DUF58 domain-containing protein n=1 Tax=Bacillus infantis NRRL B-14911 TaxID=1367477 RepID=U5LAH9_9BACI|nr:MULTISPECIES: DUF58 domain-containing protein [Bacillus]AGX03627.1 hypothetical protein N288_08520 [Bacillus infantis NRRL B-14911]EAR65072.1 hypothetical protein B14911_22212 [Bacillus sp. NRRL B-14911]
MEWKKYTVENRSLQIMSALALLLVLLSLYLTSAILFLMSSLFFCVLLANNYYLKKMGEGVEFENKAVRKRMFIEEHHEWELDFVNNGLPILNARLYVYFDDIVIPLKGVQQPRFSKYELSIPFTLPRKGEYSVRIPFSAGRRGLAKIRSMELRIPHFFGFGETVLEYRTMMAQEALIYPKRLPVENKEQFVSAKPGNEAARHTLFQDVLSPAGTRNYVPTDSFNQIHWKATARSRSIQTKVYENVSEKGLLLSLNLSEGYSITPRLEELLSCSAELAYTAVKEGIPFAVCMNIRTAGPVPFQYIPAGTGKAHLQKVLESFAVAGYHSVLYPYDKMAAHYTRHFALQPYIIHGGLKPQAGDKYFKELEQKGFTVLEMQLLEQKAWIKPFPKPIHKEVI